MSRSVPSSQELHALLRSRAKVMILFYASWCPFSRGFLPCFEKVAADGDRDTLMVLVDDVEDAADAFGVRVYPTVLFFENGTLSRRLDGRAGIGLNERQLQDFIAVCEV